MREVKFRAWDKKKKQMLHLASSQMSVINLQMNDEYWGVFEFDKRVCGSADDSGELMQWTGLVDKKGQEIFEGDMVKVSSNRIVVIEYKDGGFGYEGLGDFIGFAGHNNLEYITTEAEVIGNIYENPEIIEREEK